MPRKAFSFYDRTLLQNAMLESFGKFRLKHAIKNPVMFVTYVGAILVTISFIQHLCTHAFSAFELQIAFWLWFTVYFANFAEALAEGKSKAQALSLKKGQAELFARKLVGEREEKVKALSLLTDDLVICETGDVIPTDGEIIEGIASVDESAITGESAPVIRESGGDRSAVTGGTRVISDRIIVRVTALPGTTFIDRIINLIEGAKRQKTPNELALTIILSALSLILLIAVTSLPFYVRFGAQFSFDNMSTVINVPVLVSLLVCLIPTTIGGLLSAIGIAGMDRLIGRNVIAKSGRAIEAAGDIDVLMIDKTGTITLGNRMAVNFLPLPTIAEKDLALAAQMASLADETPEGRSVVVLAKEKFQIRAENLNPTQARFVPFSAEARMSGVDILEDDKVVSVIRKGAVLSVIELLEKNGQKAPPELKLIAERVSTVGGTPLAVIKDNRALGIIELKDVVKGGIKERFLELHKMGVKTIMITGDNPLTAAAIAGEAGVSDFIAEATPESKLERIKEDQRRGMLVAMTGDGTNDAPALAQADVGVAMNTGTQAAREAGNMVDLDSNPTKIIDIVETGKQLLMTRGALTTFSIANDIAKYFAILPAIFIGFYASNGQAEGPLSVLNVMNLHSPKSAILSAVIFNALIIIFLIPLALRGVPYRPEKSSAILSKNILIYGAGGVVVPFLGIKVIDFLLQLSHVPL